MFGQKLAWLSGILAWPGLANARASSNFAHQVRLMTALALAMINDDAAAAAEEEAAEARLSSATTAASMFVYLFAFSC